MEILLILGALVLILLNAFFVLAEFAVVKMRPTRVEELVDQGDARAKLVQQIQGRLEEYLSVCQVGVTLASIGLGFLGEPAFAHLFERFLGSSALAHMFAIATAFLLVAYLHVLFGELIPKLVAISKTESLVLLIARPLEIFRVVFFVPLVVLKRSATFILLLMGFPAQMREADHTEEELRILLAQSQTSGLMSFRRLLLLENIFDMGDLKVRDAMRSRSKVKSLRLEASWEENLQIIRESRFSRFPVLEGDGEKPLGILHIKDLLELLAPESPPQPNLRPLLRPYLTMTEDTSLENALADLQHHRRHFAIVRNAVGKWTGIIALEDVIEEIVGAIEDEFAAEAPIFLREVLNENRIVLGVKAISLTEAIPQILARLPAGELPLPAEKIARAVLEREAAMSTYLGNGLSTPHARLENLEHAVLIFARSETGVAMTDPKEKAHLIFVLLTPAHAPRMQVRLLARIAGLMGSEFLVERLREAKTVQAVWEAIRAGDPMTLH